MTLHSNCELWLDLTVFHLSSDQTIFHIASGNDTIEDDMREKSKNNVNTVNNVLQTPLNTVMRIQTTMAFVV